MDGDETVSDARRVDGDAMDTSARQSWMRVLALCSAESLDRTLDSFRVAGGTVPGFSWLRRPEVGLTMVRGRAGGTGNPFNLGEMTVTRCTLRLDDGVTGTAYVAGRDKHHAEAAALVDAMMQTGQAGAVHTAIIEPLAAEIESRRHRTERRAAATRVDFFTLVRGDNPR